MVDACQEARERVVEAAAEADEELMGLYLEEGVLSEQQIKQGIRARTLANEIVPVLCGSAFKNKGVQCMLDAVIDYLPAPDDVSAVTGVLTNASKTEISRSPPIPSRLWRLPSRLPPTRSSVR